MDQLAKLDDKDLVFLNQQWTNEDKKLFSGFLKWQKQNIDFWDKLTPEKQQEILKGIAEIERGEITNYETFIDKHRS